jgi:hypothetical protein
MGYQKKYTKSNVSLYFIEKELVECYYDIKTLWSQYAEKLGIDIDHVFSVFCVYLLEKCYQGDKVESCQIKEF